MYGGYDVYQTCPSGTQPYTIRAGDTYYSLAIRFNTTVAVNGSQPGVDHNRCELASESVFLAHRRPENAQRHAALFMPAQEIPCSLAVRFNTTVAAIMAANPVLTGNRCDWPANLYSGARRPENAQWYAALCNSGGGYFIFPGNSFWIQR